MSRVFVPLVVAALLGACRGSAWSDARAKCNETKERAYVAVTRAASVG